MIINNPAQSMFLFIDKNQLQVSYLKKVLYSSNVWIDRQNKKVLDLLNVFIAQQSKIGKHIGWGGALLTPELESNKGGIYIFT